MIGKTLKIIGKIIVGILIFYLFLVWIVLPLGLKWGIQNQGSKLLKTPVTVRSVSFHPFLWKLNIAGLKILDGNKNLLIGFEKLSVDVSVKSLLKKIYRIESVELSGLTVNAVLEDGGKINLMDLIPHEQATAVDSAVSQESSSSAANPPAAEKKDMPEVFIDQFVMDNSSVHFEDHTLTPNFQTTLGSMNLTVRNISTRPDDLVDVVFKGVVDEKGLIESKAQIKPLKKPLEMETTVTIGSYVLTVLSPYIGKYTGRSLADGRFDFQTTYRISSNKLNASHKILIQKFEFGQKVDSKDALNLPYGLALALLEDPQGRINISLPVEGDMSDPKFKYTHLIWQVTRNFFVKLVTKPFAVLGSLLGSDSSTDELGTVKFLPGKSALTDEEKTKLTELVKGLNERPKLMLEVNGSIDPVMDWKAIKTDVFNKDYAALRAESKKNEAWIYEQLFQRRFGLMDLWKLTKKFKANGKLDQSALNAEIKRILIEDSSPDKVALNYLAQERAKVIYDFLIQSGMPEKRLKLGGVKEVQGSFDAVPLEFTLTVDDSAAKSPSESPNTINTNPTDNPQTKT